MNIFLNFNFLKNILDGDLKTLCCLIWLGFIVGFLSEIQFRNDILSFEQNYMFLDQFGFLEAGINLRKLCLGDPVFSVVLHNQQVQQDC